MVSKPVKPTPPDGPRPSRRTVLRCSAAAALGAFLGPVRASDESEAVTLPKLTSLPWWMNTKDRRSRVIDVGGPRLRSVEAVDEVVLEEVLTRAVQDLVAAPTPAAAWKEILGSAERIAIKFNHVGASVIGTNDVFATALLESLKQADIGPERVTLVEVPDFLRHSLGARPAKRGWNGSVRVGGNDEELANWLLEADAVINVGLLKTHRIAGMSGAMKNMSHAVIRHPARYHGNGCSPYVAEVVGSKEVSSRLRLNIVNGLRVVARRGPDARHGDLSDAGRVIVGFDPVAVDTVGYGILNAERRRLGFGGSLNVAYLEAAGLMAVGRRAAHELELVPSL